MDSQKYATFEELTAEGQLEGEDYTIEQTGQVVRIRALSRGEVLMAQRLQDEGVAAMEAKMLSFAMVEPRMTVAKAKRWQDTTPAGRLEGLTRRVRDISGMGLLAEREAYERFRGGPADGVRDLSGSEAGPDGDGVTSDDQQS